MAFAALVDLHHFAALFIGEGAYGRFAAFRAGFQGDGAVVAKDGRPLLFPIEPSPMVERWLAAL